MSLDDLVRSLLPGGAWEAVDDQLDLQVARGVPRAEAVPIARALAGAGANAALLVEKRAWEYLEPQPLPPEARAPQPPSPKRVEPLVAALQRLERALARPLGEVLPGLDLELVSAFEEGELDAAELRESLETAPVDASLDDRDRVADAQPGSLVLRLRPPSWALTGDAAWKTLSKGGAVDLVVGEMDPPSLLARIGFGGFNDCPDAEVQAATWKYFAKTWRARPVLVEGDRLQAVVLRPPTTIDGVAALTATILDYDGDLLQDSPPLQLACELWGSAIWRFWWD
jgi:hypothetical protein